MKHLYLFLLSLLPIIGHAQNGYFRESFEAPYNLHADRFYIDTVNYPNNIWQVGKPGKTIFDSAFSYPNAIVTDTANVYPVNDTSVFTVKIETAYNNNIGLWYLLQGFSFRYKLDIDSGEIAKIEIATDSGKHWVNLLEEDTTYKIQWPMGKPDFTKSTDGWKVFDINMVKWVANSLLFDHQLVINRSRDTTYLRFTFISDSVQTNKDGWMIDDFYLQTFAESITEVRNNSLLSIYPNPAGDYIFIKRNYGNTAAEELAIYNMEGKVVLTTKDIPTNGYIPISLPHGVYTVAYKAGAEHAVKQLVICK